MHAFSPQQHPTRPGVGKIIDYLPSEPPNAAGINSSFKFHASTKNTVGIFGYSRPVNSKRPEVEALNVGAVFPLTRGDGSA